MPEVANRAYCGGGASLAVYDDGSIIIIDSRDGHMLALGRHEALILATMIKRLLGE